MNNVSTLPCETWNAHRTRATIELLQEETPEFIPPQLWPQICQIWIQLITAWGEYRKKRRCTNMNWKSDWERSGPSWIMSSLRQSLVSGVTDSSKAVMRVLYTFYYNISHMLLSTGFKSGEIGGHSWGGINLGVSFWNNSTVARAQWAFQLSQGSVETSGEVENVYIILLRLYSWNDERCTKFHQNLPSFMGDITEQDAQLSQRDRAAGCVRVFPKSKRLELGLGDSILRTL